jgi:hypothetical protein
MAWNAAIPEFSILGIFGMACHSGILVFREFHAIPQFRRRTFLQAALV